MPRVSIIIPTHNRAALLSRAVDSALNAGGDSEVIVVDDASTDDTPAVCATLQNVGVIRLDKNVGLAGARNAGIRESRADYIAILDDDDARLPDSLPAQIAALDENTNAALCYAPVMLADADTLEPNGKTTPQDFHEGDLFWRLLRGNFIPAISAVVRRSHLMEAGGFDPSLRQVEDWDLWLRLTERHHVVAVREPVAIYRDFRRDSGQLSSNRALMALASAAVQKKTMGLPRARKEKRRAEKIRESYLCELRFSLMQEVIESLLASNNAAAAVLLRAISRLKPATIATSPEYRRLLAITFLPPRADERAVSKELKSLRKQLWDDFATHVPSCEDAQP